jgi:hypothetical protein
MQEMDMTTDANGLNEYFIDRHSTPPHEKNKQNIRARRPPVICADKRTLAINSANR